QVPRRSRGHASGRKKKGYRACVATITVPICLISMFHDSEAGSQVILTTSHLLHRSARCVAPQKMQVTHIAPSPTLLIAIAQFNRQRPTTLWNTLGHTAVLQIPTIFSPQKFMVRTAHRLSGDLLTRQTR